MKLELNTSSLEVMFECTDEYANDLEILDAIRELLYKLEHHEGVKLTIVTKADENLSEDETDENLDEVFPVRDE